ncbi:MAG: hypothetical protein JWR67_2948 [Mucilaginibacter sp.]|nr:hypothetical protein [Mucilaginibacter sp.]
MTYRQYYIKLIRDITETEKFIEQKYKELNGDNVYLKEVKLDAYLDLQNELSLLMSKCDKVAQLITSRQVKSTDEVSADTLRFLPGNIGTV